MACCLFQGMQDMQPQNKMSLIVRVSLVNLEILNARQKETKVQGQEISFLHPLLDIKE